MSVHTSTVLEENRRSCWIPWRCRWLWATMWALRIELGSSPVGAPSPWAISKAPLPNLVFKVSQLLPLPFRVWVTMQERWKMAPWAETSKNTVSAATLVMASKESCRLFGQFIEFWDTAKCGFKPISDLLHSNRQNSHEQLHLLLLRSKPSSNVIVIAN